MKKAEKEAVDKKKTVKKLLRVPIKTNQNRWRYHVRNEEDPREMSQPWQIPSWEQIHGYIEPGPSPRGKRIRSVLGRLPFGL